MRYLFMSLALLLVSTVAAVSAGVSAADATGTTSATVVAPAHTGTLLDTVAFSTGVSGDLIIHIPGRSQPAIPNEHLNSVPSELSRISENRCRNTGSLVDCLAPRGEHGLLQGNPVHDILMDINAQGTSGKGHVGLTLVYN